jgi:hypothetical protein
MDLLGLQRKILREFDIRFPDTDYPLDPDKGITIRDVVAENKRYTANKLACLEQRGPPEISGDVRLVCFRLKVEETIRQKIEQNLEAIAEPLKVRLKESPTDDYKYMLCQLVIVEGLRQGSNEIEKRIRKLGSGLFY